MNKIWPYTVPGIPDELFMRGHVPMTKREVRVLTIAQARLQPKLIVWDIGAGTGSLSVEAALFTEDGQVYAVEKNTTALALIQKNVQHFALNNITIVSGTAPDVLNGMPDPHRILVGGSGGKLQTILQICGERLMPGGRIVVNALSPRNMVRTLEVLQQPPFIEAQSIYLQASRMEKLGSEYVFRAQNGIWIISAAKEA